MTNWKELLEKDAEKSVSEIEPYHGCFTGDCLHQKQVECNATLANAICEKPNARLLKAIEVIQDTIDSGYDQAGHCNNYLENLKNELKGGQ